jgi:hypothetical protein
MYKDDAPVPNTKDIATVNRIVVHGDLSTNEPTLEKVDVNLSWRFLRQSDMVWERRGD